MRNRYFRPTYQKSWAICIGVDEYINCGDLDCAVADATAIANSFDADLNIDPDSITLLTNADATRSGILTVINDFIQDPTVSSDDRLIFFFAGHGHTLETIRGDVGYLVPSDGNVGDISTLISWQNIVDMFELSFAKHILFVIDACYSGLAVLPKTRSVSQRFIHDLLTREARQVIASGMKDQEVADDSDNRPGHSIFAASLLDVLERKELKSSVVTATQVMSFLRTRVGQDPASLQTPHYGTLFGDGDMLLFMPDTEEAKASETYAVVDYSNISTVFELQDQIVAEQLSKLLSSDQLQIELDSFVIEQARLYQNWFKDFWQRTVSSDWRNRIPEVVVELEEASKLLITIATLLGYWGRGVHHRTVKKLLSEVFSPEYLPIGGNNFLLALGHYPALLCVKAVAISALSASNRSMFVEALTSEVRIGINRATCTASRAYSHFHLEANRAKFGEHLPNVKNMKFPISERAFLVLQSTIDKLIHCGVSYEDTYHEAETYLFLTSYCETSHVRPDNWGVPGRFLYKNYDYSYEDSKLKDIMLEAQHFGVEWWPSRLGLIKNEAKIASAFKLASEWSAKHSW